MIEAPTPKYKIGDSVWLASTESTTERLPCPDCKGEKVWQVQSPAGEQFTCACPRCQTTYSFRNGMPSLDVQRVKPVVECRVITGISLDAASGEFRDAIEYRSSNSSCSWRTMKEAEMYDSEEAAMRVAKLKAAERNTALDEEPQILRSRHFSSLSMQEGKFDQYKNGLWSAHYHAGDLLQRVNAALDGEDGDEERNPDAIIEDLREAVRWDFSYHVEHMPLREFFAAASDSPDPAMKAAFDALPEGMRELFGKAKASDQFIPA
jgi:uncharacterized protein YbaR (Trm112 family)